MVGFGHLSPGHQGGPLWRGCVSCTCAPLLSSPAGTSPPEVPSVTWLWQRRRSSAAAVSILQNLLACRSELVIPVSLLVVIPRPFPDRGQSNKRSESSPWRRSRGLPCSSFCPVLKTRVLFPVRVGLRFPQFCATWGDGFTVRSGPRRGVERCRGFRAQAWVVCPSVCWLSFIWAGVSVQRP